MSNVIPFKRKTKELTIKEQLKQTEFEERMRRIKESLEKINALMSDMKHKPGTSRTTGIGDKT